MGTPVPSFLITLISVFCIAIFGASAQEHGELDSLSQRIQSLYSKEKHSEALPLAREYAAKAQDFYGPNSGFYGSALVILGEGMLWTSDLVGAETTLSEAKGILEALGPSADENTALAYSYLGLTAKYRGLYPLAEERYQKAIDLGTRVHGRRHLNVSADLNNLAELYREQGKYKEGELLHREAWSIREELHPASLEVAETLNNLGLLYQNAGRLPDAEAALLRAVKLRRDLLEPLNPRLASSLNNLGLVYKSLEQYEKALNYMQDALDIWKQSLPPDHPRIGIGLHNVADVLRSLQRFRESEKNFVDAIAIFEKAYGKDHPNVSTALNNLAQLYRMEGADEKAVPRYKRALDAWTRSVGKEHPRVAVATYNLAAAYGALGDWPQALSYFRAAMDITVATARRGKVSESETARAALASHRERFVGHVDAAYKLFQHDPKANAVLEDESFRAAQWAKYSNVSTSLSQMAARAGAGDERVSGTIRQRQDLLLEWHARDSALITAISKPSDERQAAAEQEHRNRLAVIDGLIADIDKQLQAKLPTYAALVDPEPLSLREVRSYLRDHEALVLFLDTPEAKPIASETFVWVVTKTQSRWIRSSLGTKELADRVQALRCGLDDAEWEGIERPARCAKLLEVGMPAEDEPLPFSFSTSHELYEALLAPVGELIADKSLLVVPSGPLTSLPFQVLVTEPARVPIGLRYDDYEGVAWLAHRQTIAVLPSVTSLRSLRQFAKASPSPNAYIGYGDPVLTGDPECPAAPEIASQCPGAAKVLQVAATASPRLQRMARRSAAPEQIYRGQGDHAALLNSVRRLCPLPDTAEEVRCVGHALDALEGDMVLGERATEASLKHLSDEGPLGTYRTIHFATHGLLAGDIETMTMRRAEPALVLTPPRSPEGADDDGLLTASEVTRLKLNADWVIMSACNTAAGEQLGAEAFSGLARAFFYAGARALLVSHWPVYSYAASQLITTTFRELNAHPSLERAEAHRRAMVALMTDYSEPENVHPMAWAPFVVVGEGGPQ